MRPKDNNYITEAAADGLPVMLVNGYLEGKNIYSTVCDDYASMYDATLQLIHSGHSRILYLYTSVSYSGMNKMEGYKAALKESNIPADASMIRQCSKSIENSRDLLLKLKEEDFI